MDAREIPFEVGALQQLADTQPGVARELFYWALAMVMVERGKARIVEQHTEDGREHITFASPEGEVVKTVRPDVNDTVLEQMMTAVRATVEGEFRALEKQDQSEISRRDSPQ